MRVWLLSALALSATSTALAQPALITVEEGVARSASRRWRARVEAALDEAPRELEAWAEASEPVETVPESRLEILSLIETLLVRARHATARLEERDALITLLHAQALAEGHLDIPGIASWYAEVQLALAITAAQVGQDGVSEVALRRAASVDPERGVHAAEARPEVVARGLQFARAAATAPTGRFEVSADALGAVVFIDDRRAGALPAVVQAPVGVHVLRVDAPGRRSWAVLIDVFEGERAPIRVALAPTPRAHAVVAVERAAREGNLGALEGALAELPDAPLLWLVQAGSGPRDRALLYACRASGCAGPLLLEDAPATLNSAELPRELDPARAQRWLAEPQDRVAPDPAWYERWYVWVAAGVVLAGAAAAAVGVAVASDQEGEAPLVLHVDPSGLPVRGVD